MRDARNDNKPAWDGMPSEPRRKPREADLLAREARLARRALGGAAHDLRRTAGRLLDPHRLVERHPLGAPLVAAGAAAVLVAWMTGSPPSESCAEPAKESAGAAMRRRTRRVGRLAGGAALSLIVRRALTALWPAPSGQSAAALPDPDAE